MSTPEIMKTVGVYTENEYLLQKIRLELCDVARTVLLEPGSMEACDIVLVDGDNPSFSGIHGLQMKHSGGDITIPFRIGSLRRLIEREEKAFIEPIPIQKAVRIGNKTVKLTELEFSLFSLLVSKKGAYVSRQEILQSVWAGRADRGIINVYIHYLREKLECDGEKIILSSRNYGYKISGKYIGGDADA